MKSSIENSTEIIGKNQVVLLLVENESYNNQIMDLATSLSKKSQLILYITLNRPCTKLLSEFQKRHIDAKKFHIIDVVSKDIKFSKVMEGCSYVSSNELTELSVRITEILRNKHPDVMIFDSFHTMMAYQDRNIITRFAHDLITKLDTCSCRGVFPLIGSDRGAPLTADLEMFVDEVIDLV